MLDTKQIPNSITNSTSTTFNDVTSPYPYITFVTFFAHKSTIDIIQIYNDYVDIWNQTKVSNRSKDVYNTSIKDKYIELIKSINVTYTTEEEKRFLTNLDLHNELHRDLLIPFYVNKINDITNYFIDKREKIKFTIEKNKRSNSKQGIIAQLKSFIIDELTQNNNYSDISNYTKNALIEDLELDILEKYDTFSHYYDVDPNTTASQYDVKNTLFKKYFKNNILDYNRIAFVDENSYLVSAIKEYALIIMDIGFGVVFTSNTDEIHMLKPKDFISHTVSNTVDDLNISTFKSLSQKYAGTDMYYTSAFDNTVITDKLYSASASYNNILNKKYTSIQNTPAENFIDKRNTGTFFLPNNQNISIYSAYNKEYNLKDNLSGICMFPDPDVCGNIYGTSLTQLSNYPYSYQTSLTNMFYEKSYKQIAGQINSNAYQDFTGYKTEIKKCTLLNNFESITNKGIITNYKVDIFGNEYAIFKNKSYNIPDTIHVNSDNISDYVVSRFNAISADSTINTHVLYDGGNFYQSINNDESDITSDYYEWPDLNKAYFYDIILEGGLHDTSVRLENDPFAGFPYRPYSKTINNDAITVKPANFVDVLTSNVYDKCYIYDGNCVSGGNGFINTNCNSIIQQITNIPVVSNRSSKTTYSQLIKNDNVKNGIYNRLHQPGITWFKYSNTDTCLPLTDVFNFIDDISTFTITNIDIISDVLIITHETGLIFCKIYINDAGKISKPSIQIKHYNKQNCKYSHYFYIEKDNSILFAEFKKIEANVGDVKPAFIPTIYSLSLDQLNETKVYECVYDNNNYSGNGYNDLVRFGSEKLKGVNINNIDVPILTYNSLNNILTVTFTTNIESAKYIINFTFINRHSNAELIAYDIYCPITDNINSPKLRLIETQMLDNDNNHIFCIFEEEKTQNIMIAILLQSTNRVKAYEQKLEDDEVIVFSTCDETNIISIANTIHYKVDQNIDTTIVVVPCSTKNVHYVESYNNNKQYTSLITEKLIPIIEANNSI